MTESANKMPPFEVLAAALRKTTEHLARELAQPTDCPPSWTELEWTIARCVATMQGISVLLAHNLRWRGPPPWQAFLAEQCAQAALRHVRIGALLEHIDTATRAAGIACVGLKGSALRTLGIYRPGERPMGDVDLLVRREDMTNISAAMGQIDYVEAYAMRRHTVYEPRLKPATLDFGEHVDNPLKIEIHPAVAERLPVQQVDITTRLWPARAQPGLNFYPGVAELMLHSLLHAAGNMLTNALRQIQLHDIAALAVRLQDADWGAVLATRKAVERPWWVYPPLALAARYYPGRVPQDALHELRNACPLVLRFTTDRKTLTDVSWSNLRIHAVPGIAWSRTPLDALRYLRRRALPDRTSLAELRLAVRAQPHLNRVSWYGLSHRARIVRWLFSRPPRVQTIASVAAALESSGR